MLILDFDDKARTGRINELLERFNVAFPDIMPRVYIERSPGGSGAHVCILVHIGDLSHQEANVLLSEMSGRIKAVVNRPENPEGLDFDAIKGTFPWVEAWYDDGHINEIIDSSQGVFGTMPMPRTEEDLSKLENMKCFELTDLASAILASPIPTVPCMETTPGSVTCHTAPMTRLPLSPTPLTTCVSQNDTPPTHHNVKNTTTHDSNVSYDSTTPPASKSKGRCATIAKIREEKDPQARKLLFVIWQSHQLGRPVQEEETEAMAAAYVEHALNDTDPDWPKLTDQFRRAIQKVAARWDFSLALGQGPASQIYDFVDSLNVEALFGPLLKKRITPEAILGTMRVFLHLTATIDEPKDPKDITRYRFTVGLQRIKSYIRKAKEKGAAMVASANRNVISAVRTVAMRMGWVWLLQPYAIEKFSNRYMPGRNNPTQLDFLEKNWESLKDFDVARQALAYWTPPAVRILNQMVGLSSPADIAVEVVPKYVYAPAPGGSELSLAL
jgi:hypothetical protein